MMVHSLFPQRSRGLSFLQILELFLPGFGNVLISITFSKKFYDTLYKVRCQRHLLEGGDGGTWLIILTSVLQYISLFFFCNI